MSKNNIYNPDTNIVYWDEVLKIPEFKRLTKIPQNILWHKEGDAFTHTRMVVECMIDHIDNVNNTSFEYPEYRKILVFAALLHDIGKLVTTKKEEDGLYHCKDHAIKGVLIAERILNTYMNDLNPIYKKGILSLVRYHMQPLYILNRKNPESAILKLANDLEYIDFESLLLLKECDCKGSITNQVSPYKQILNDVRKLYYKICSYPKLTKVHIEKIGVAETSAYKTNNHPNGINVGYQTTGYLVTPITVGYRAYIGMHFSTSPVVKIIDKNHFQTKNSIYLIEEVKDGFNNLTI